MLTILRRAPSRTITALRQVIFSHIEKMKDELFANHKNDIVNAKDEIEAAKINAIFHEKLAFLYHQLVEELSFFDAALKLAKRIDEVALIEFLREYFAAKRRRIAENKGRSELEDNGIDGLLEIILSTFIIGFWIGYINQVRKDEHLYSLAIKAGIDEFDQNLSKIDKMLSNHMSHTKKDTRRAEKGE